MNERGTYGKVYLGAASYGRLYTDPPSALYGRAYLVVESPRDRGSSLGMWLLGGLVAGGVVLWAKHQSDQIKKLSATAGLPYQGFTMSLGERTRELAGTAREKFQELAHRLGTRKELKDGT